MVIASRSSSRVPQRFRFRTFVCRSAKNDSIAALSAHAPTRPIDPRDRNTVVGEFEDQRVDRLAGCDWAKYATALRRISFSCLRSRIRFCASRRSAWFTAFADGDAPTLIPSSRSAVREPQPAGQAGLGDARVLRDLPHRRLDLPGDRDHKTAELFRIRLHRGAHPSCRSQRPYLSGLNRTCSSPVCLASLPHVTAPATLPDHPAAKSPQAP